MKGFKEFFLNEFCILYLIIANAVLIFVQEFSLNIGVTDYLEPVFTLLFIIEMFVKIHELGFKKYISITWNKMDFVLVLLSLPSLGVVFFGSAVQLNIFLALRVFRVFKFFRLLRFFPNINELINSIKLALKASYVVLIGFFLLVFIISLLTCALYKNIVPEYFSNPLESFYSIFRLFSIEGWYEIPDLIATRTNSIVAFLSKAYFAFLLLCGGILGLSLVNSIFVDAMVSDNNDELKKEVKELNKKLDMIMSMIEDN